MEQIEVPREHWRSFAEEFSGEHHGWLVTVADADTAGLGGDPRAWLERWHPLHEGVRLEALVLRDTDGTVDGRVQLHSDDTLLDVRLNDLQRLIRVRLDDRHVGLRLDGRGARSLLVWFRVAAVPAELDGILASEI